MKNGTKYKNKTDQLIQQRIEIAVYTIIAAVQLMLYRYRAHAALAAVLLDLPAEIAFRAKKQLAAFVLIAGTGTAILHAYAFIFRAIFYEHLFSRPYTGYY
jgi:hypothetical protein